MFSEMAEDFETMVEYCDRETTSLDVWAANCPDFADSRRRVL
jgi:hypothetical protein